MHNPIPESYCAKRFSEFLKDTHKLAMMRFDIHYVSSSKIICFLYRRKGKFTKCILVQCSMAL